jgi:hypothetical protein
MVGDVGFELTTLCSQNRCATTALIPEKSEAIMQFRPESSRVRLESSGVGHRHFERRPRNDARPVGAVHNHSFLVGGVTFILSVGEVDEVETREFAIGQPVEGTPFVAAHGCVELLGLNRSPSGVGDSLGHVEDDVPPNKEATLGSSLQCSFAPGDSVL